MRVDLALFDGDALLDRGCLRVGPQEAVDRFELFCATHQLGVGVADIMLADFDQRVGLKTIALSMPIHASSDWEAIELERYTLAFWCWLDE